MLPEKHRNPVDGFRWRSHEITRIEGFSEAVFGIAVTLLIVSLEVVDMVSKTASRSSST